MTQTAQDMAGAALLLIGFAAVIGVYFGRAYEAESDFRHDAKLEQAYKWAEQQGYVQQSQFSMPQAPASDDVLPPKGKLTTTTVNHLTGEVIEKYKAE